MCASQRGRTRRDCLRLVYVSAVLSASAVFAAAPVFVVSALASPAQDVGRQVAPEVTRVDLTRLDRIDGVVEDAIRDGALPGAVVLVWHQGEVVYHKAFGHRSLVPVTEVMTTDTIFDLASLTKVVATTTAVMILVEDGRIRLRDPVARYLTGFERHGKAGITVEHLLTHHSGLRPDFPLEEEFEGYDVAIAKAIDERPVAAPGSRFVYSDINFIVLGEIVHRVSGLPLDRFVTQRVFEPLQMRDTRFHPSVADRERIAPTEACRPRGWPCGDPGSVMLRGTVHDPTARRMGGVAGHAGLFGTAADLARFGAMLVAGGRLDDVRVLAPLTVARMSTPATPPGTADRRGLGWDIDSRYSSNRGDLFSVGSYGHTGFTGTSMWLDPATQTVVVFLSSRVHPDGQGNVTSLRGRVATLAAAALTDVDLPAGQRAAVRSGLDRLRDEGFVRVQGAQVGLLTNQSGRASDGSSTIDLLHAAPNVDLRRLFSPEHGIRGELDTRVPDGTDAVTGLTVHSLYADTRRPTPAMLEGLDIVVVDLQDVGARFYTYATTLAYLMEAAASQGVRVMVLDRPNPIGGLMVEGPLLDDTERGFNGYLSMPVRHGLTLGELAQLFNTERDIGVELEVVPMDGWRRRLWYDDTGMHWVNPSPNLRSVTQAALYPGVGAIERTNLAVGRGTDTPFEQIGAPWIDGTELAAALNRRGLDGIRFYPVSFTPSSAVYAGELCQGVRMTVTNRELLRPVRVGVEIAAAVHQLYPDSFELEPVSRLLGSRASVDRLEAGDDPAAIAADWRSGERQWQERIAPYLLYLP